MARAGSLGTQVTPPPPSPRPARVGVLARQGWPRPAHAGGARGADRPAPHARRAVQRSGPIRRWPPRSRPGTGSRSPRRRPAGSPSTARRGAPQRLPADADDRGAQRRPVASEPRVGVSDAGPARGRGPDPLHGVRWVPPVRDHRCRPRAPRDPLGGARTLGSHGRGGRECPRRARTAGDRSRQGRLAGRLSRRRGPARAGHRAAVGNPTQPVPDPRRGSRRIRGLRETPRTPRSRRANVQRRCR